MRNTYSFQPPWYMQGRYVFPILMLLAMLLGIYAEPMYRDPISGKTMTVEEYKEVLAERERKQEEINHRFHEQVLEAEKRSQYQDVHNQTKPRKNARRTHAPSGLSLGSKKDAEEPVRDSIYKSTQVLSDGVETGGKVVEERSDPVPIVAPSDAGLPMKAGRDVDPSSIGDKSKPTPNAALQIDPRPRKPNSPPPSAVHPTSANTP
jgi:hypothetical protein